MAGAIARAERDLAEVRREIGDLEQQLAAAKERAGKIAVFLEMAQIYGANGGGASNPSPSSAIEPKLTPSIDSKGGLAKAAAREVITVLRERGQPVHTKELLDILRARGIEIAGRNPVTNLSGYLSRSPELTADRAAGWSLAEWSRSQIRGGKAWPINHSVRDRKPKGGVAAAAIRETVRILQEREGPIKTRELLVLLATRGITIGGKQPVINLSSSLCRAPELLSERGHGWVLKERQQPELGSQTNFDHPVD